MYSVSDIWALYIMQGLRVQKAEVRGGVAAGFAASMSFSPPPIEMDDASKPSSFYGVEFIADKSVIRFHLDSEPVNYVDTHPINQRHKKHSAQFSIYPN